MTSIVFIIHFNDRNLYIYLVEKNCLVIFCLWAKGYKEKTGIYRNLLIWLQLQYEQLWPKEKMLSMFCGNILNCSKYCTKVEYYDQNSSQNYSTTRSNTSPENTEEYFHRNSCTPGLDMFIQQLSAGLLKHVTILITMATVERSFSPLRRLKTYLRNNT